MSSLQNQRICRDEIYLVRLEMITGLFHQPPISRPPFINDKGFIFAKVVRILFAQQPPTAAAMAEVEQRRMQNFGQDFQ